eukprot:17986-Heterococcus_DN1.PRE.2
MPELCRPVPCLLLLAAEAVAGGKGASGSGSTGTTAAAVATAFGAAAAATAVVVATAVSSCCAWESLARAVLGLLPSAAGDRGEGMLLASLGSRSMSCN